MRPTMVLKRGDSSTAKTAHRTRKYVETKKSIIDVNFYGFGFRIL